jgi:TetR/AcrR family tetracycline transcriptional repressor
VTRRASLWGVQSKSEPALDQPQVIQAALDLLDEVGLDGLTMRRLAEKLDIKAPSLYWHVRNKDHLLSLLAEAICARTHLPESTLPWRQQIEALAHEYRRALLARRDGARVLASVFPSGTNRLRLIELVLRNLLNAGFSRRDAAYAGFMLNDFVTMFVMEETRPIEQPANGQEGPPTTAQEWVEGLSPGEYPSVRALADHLMDNNAQERFVFGLEVLLDGLERRLIGKS